MPSDKQLVALQITRFGATPQVPAPVQVQRVVLLRTHAPELAAVNVPPLVRSNRICVTPEVPRIKYLLRAS